MLLVANEKNQFLVYFSVGGGVGVEKGCGVYLVYKDEGRSHFSSSY